MSDLKQTLPSSTRALPFTCDPTTIETITTTADVVFTLDSANAADGTTISLAILQNHPVDFPADFIELSGSSEPVLGKMNYYILARLNGTYQFVRYQSADDVIESADGVGRTQLTVVGVTATSTSLSWTAATRAERYTVKRYTTVNYSDAPVTVYTGSDLTFTDTGLTADTHYYYKINPGTTTVTGRAAFAAATTASLMSTVLFDHVFENINDFGGGVDIESYEGTNRAHFYPSCNQNPYSISSSVAAAQIVAGDNFRLTLTGVVFGNSDQNGDVTFGGVHFDINPAEIVNETLVLNGTATQTSGSLILGYNPYRCDSNFYLREIKIEKMLAPVYTKLTGTAFGTSNYLGSSATTTFDKMFDGDLTTFFDAIDGSNGYAGLDLGTAKIVNKIKVAARAGLENRSQGIILQGSNSSSSDGYTNLFTIPDALTANVLTEYTVNNTTAYRYYRMYSSPNGYCNLSEAEFYTSQQ